MLTYVLENLTQTTEELVRGASNLLVANIYWVLAFKIHVFDNSLFEEMTNRSNSEIWELFLSLIFSPIL